MSSLQARPKGTVGLTVGSSSDGPIVKPVWRREVTKDEVNRIRGDTTATAGTEKPIAIDFRNPLNFCDEDKKALSHNDLPNFLFHAAEAYTELHEVFKRGFARPVGSGAIKSQERLKDTVLSLSAYSAAEELGERIQNWSRSSLLWLKDQEKAAVSGPGRDLSTFDYDKLKKVLPASVFQTAMRRTVETQRRRAKWAITRTMGIAAVNKAVGSLYETFGDPEAWIEGDMEEMMRTQKKHQIAKMKDYMAMKTWLDDVYQKYSDNVGGGQVSADDTMTQDTYTDLQDKLHAPKLLRDVLDSECNLKSVRKALRGGNGVCDGSGLSEDEGLVRLYTFLDGHLAQDLQDEIVRAPLSSAAPETKKKNGQGSSWVPRDTQTSIRDPRLRQVFDRQGAREHSRMITQLHSSQDKVASGESFESVSRSGGQDVGRDRKPKKPFKPTRTSPNGSTMWENSTNYADLQYAEAKKAILAMSVPLPIAKHRFIRSSNRDDFTDQTPEPVYLPPNDRLEAIIKSEEERKERIGIETQKRIELEELIDTVFRGLGLKSDVASLSEKPGTEAVGLQTRKGKGKDRKFATAANLAAYMTEPKRRGGGKTDTASAAPSSQTMAAETVGTSDCQSESAEAVSRGLTAESGILINSDVAAFMDPSESLGSRLDSIDQSFTYEHFQNEEDRERLERIPRRRRSFGENEGDWHDGSWSIRQEKNRIRKAIKQLNIMTGKSHEVDDTTDDGNE